MKWKFTSGSTLRKKTERQRKGNQMNTAWNSKGTLLQVDIKIQLREPKNKTLKKQTLHSEREREREREQAHW